MIWIRFWDDIVFKSRDFQTNHLQTPRKSTRKVLAGIYNFLTRTTNLEITRKPEKTVSVIKSVFDKKSRWIMRFFSYRKVNRNCFLYFFSCLINATHVIKGIALKILYLYLHLQKFLTSWCERWLKNSLPNSNYFQKVMSAKFC